MSSSRAHNATDIVSFTALHLSTTVGLDHWHRARPQPIELSLYLHLTPFYLDAPGRSDDVANSLHYGHLTKAVEKRVGAKGDGYAHARALIEDVTAAAFEFAKDAEGAVRAVRVVVSLPKQILLAGGFEVECTTRAGEEEAGAIVRVTALTLPVLIGVNPPERLAKQRVVTDLTFFEGVGGAGEVDYPAIVQEIAQVVERSSYLTLEKLVYEILRTGYRAAGAVASRIEAITARCRKPSALSFADASGVEMTRTQDAFAA